MEDNKNVPETAEEAVMQDKKEKKEKKQDPKKLLAEIEELLSKEQFIPYHHNNI